MAKVIPMALMTILLALPSTAFTQLITSPTSIQVVGGDVQPTDLRQGRYILYFYLPTGCPACEIFDDYILTLDTRETSRLISVTNSKEVGTTSEPRGNVWLDPNNELGKRLGVTKAPALFFVEDGDIRFAASWPFYGNLGGLRRLLKDFVYDGFSRPKPASILADIYTGTRLPSFVFQRSNPTAPRLSTEDLLADQGRVLLIACAASCGVCREELDALEEVNAELSKAFDKIWIILDAQPYEISDDYLPKGLAAKVILDSEGSFFNTLQIVSTPTHFIVDEEGVVTWYRQGYAPALVNEWIHPSGDLSD